MSVIQITMATLLVLALTAAAALAQETLRGGNALGAGGAKRTQVPQQTPSETVPGQAERLMMQALDDGQPPTDFPADGSLAEQIEAIRAMREEAMRRAATMGAFVDSMDRQAGARVRAERERAADQPPSPATALFLEFGRKAPDQTPYDVTRTAAAQAAAELLEAPEEALTGAQLRLAILREEARALFRAHSVNGSTTNAAPDTAGATAPEHPAANASIVQARNGGAPTQPSTHDTTD